MVLLVVMEWYFLELVLALLVLIVLLHIGLRQQGKC